MENTTITLKRSTVTLVVIGMLVTLVLGIILSTRKWKKEKLAHLHGPAEDKLMV